MVKYPIKKPGARKNTAKRASVIKDESDGKDTSGYSGRGMKLESQINLTCEFYLINDIAVIHKKPTPVQVVKFRSEKSKYAISEAYFRQASTTDYNGIYRGRHIDFEAKETKTHASFNLDNMHEHQLKHMLQVQKHGGIAFIIVGFWRTSEIFLIDAKVMAEFYYDKNCKSVPLNVFREKAHLIPTSYTKPVDFLATIDKIYFENI